jgi:hypothetical protein
VAILGVGIGAAHRVGGQEGITIWRRIGDVLEADLLIQFFFSI